MCEQCWPKTGLVEVDEKAPWPECDNHFEKQHRDGRKPWCTSCGWYRGRIAIPAEHVMKNLGAG